MSDHDLEALAVLMSKNPDFAAQLADAIAKRLDEDYGWGQGEIKADLEALQQGQKNLFVKLEDHDKRFNTIDHNFEMFDQRQTLFEGELRKVNDRLGKIDGRLGINTDTRRRA